MAIPADQLLVVDLPPDLSPVMAAQRLGGWPHLVLFDSNQVSTLSRYSFLTADPVSVFRLRHVTADPLAQIDRWQSDLTAQPADPAHPPFTGGIVALLSYDLGGCFERLPTHRHNEFDYPLLWSGLYDWSIVWEHAAVSPAPSSSSTVKSARLYCRRLADGPSPTRRRDEVLTRLSTERIDGAAENAVSWRRSGVPHHGSAFGCTAPQYGTRLPGEWIGNFDSPGFRQAVDQVRQYIAAGDIFQANLAQRLMRPASLPSWALYKHLRQASPAPFSAYFDGGDFQLLSSSPERFLQVDGQRIVTTRPIKGTRPRSGIAADDRRVAEELAASAKDRAENVMIVDLMRNDLSRVCDPRSIEVTELCRLEAYPQVWHLVSTVRGQLRPAMQIADLLAATFPGGSITGAPKIRAMEIIAELEPTVRGPYCGSLGYIGVDGRSDWNILIRSILASGGWWQFNVGGGITFGSDPSAEEQETWDKAAGMLKAIDAAGQRDDEIG